ncbi:MAG: MoaD/ThiS family protein [Saccharolobus sp.]|jgi:molybdopterin converting factor small subunit
MPKIILRGPLITQFNRKEIELDGENIFEILSKLDNNRKYILNNKNEVKPGIIILINGKDWKLYDNLNIKDNDIIEIIPVNHGG